MTRAARPTKKDRNQQALALQRFANLVFNDSTIRDSLDNDAFFAGMVAVQERMRALTARPGPKPRKQYTLNTPQFTVALARAREEILYGNAVRQIMALSCCNYRTAQKHLREMKQSAEQTAAALQALQAGPEVRR